MKDAHGSRTRQRRELAHTPPPAKGCAPSAPAAGKEQLQPHFGGDGENAAGCGTAAEGWMDAEEMNRAGGRAGAPGGTQGRENNRARPRKEAKHCREDGDGKKVDENTGLGGCEGKGGGHERPDSVHAAQLRRRRRCSDPATQMNPKPPARSSRCGPGMLQGWVGRRQRGSAPRSLCLIGHPLHGEGK